LLTVLAAFVVTSVLVLEYRSRWSLESMFIFLLFHKLNARTLLSKALCEACVINCLFTLAESWVKCTVWSCHFRQAVANFREKRLWVLIF